MPSHETATNWPDSVAPILSGSSFDGAGRDSANDAALNSVNSSSTDKETKHCSAPVKSSEEIFGDRASGSMLCRLIRNGPVTWL